MEPRRGDLNVRNIEVSDMFDLHPGKLTWNVKMEVWKMILLFKGMIFRFHVHFLWGVELLEF